MGFNNSRQSIILTRSVLECARPLALFFSLLFKPTVLFISFIQRLLPFCFLFGFLNATQYQPWLGNFYEFDFRTSILYQRYTWLETDGHSRSHRSNDLFVHASLSNAIPDPAIGVEFEIVEASTRKQRRGDLDALKLTGRRIWLDDVVGDPVSLSTGLSYCQAFEHSLKDVSSFHHGLYNAELFASIGKETPEDMFWASHWSAVAAFGMAERGSPWIRLNFDYEKRWREFHEIGAFVHTLWGFGSRSLHLEHFRGYGSVNHQSIDCGVRYRYLIEYVGSASIDYSFRVYGKNFPVYAHQICLQLICTFGL